MKKLILFVFILTLTQACSMTPEQRYHWANALQAMSDASAQANRPVQCKKIGDISGRVFFFTGFCPTGFFPV